MAAAGGSANSGGASSTGGQPSSTSGGAALAGGNANSAGERSSQAGQGGASETGGSEGAEPLLPRPELVISGQNAGYFKPGSWKKVSTAAVVTVNSSQTYQTMRGFGGAFSERGWVALGALGSADRALAMRLLFSRNDGANFTWGRIPMGANHYARERFTYDDIDEGSDETLEHFSIERDQDPSGGVMPFVQAAQAIRSDIKFWAVPWTPPPWMKDNRAYDGGSMIASAPNLATYANYFVRFIQAYENAGIPIHSVHPQNEPDWVGTSPSCAWGPSSSNTADTLGAPFLGNFVVNHLYPAVRSAGLDTEIWYGTFSDPEHCSTYWRELVDEGGSRLVQGVGLQWGCQNADEMRADNPELVIMMSEHQPGNSPWASPAASLEAADASSFWSEQAPNNYNFGIQTWALFKDWIGKTNVNVYNAWHMVLDDEGVSLDTDVRWPQNSLLAVDLEAKKLVVTPAYYVFRHISQFLDPGAVRIGTTGGDALAFKNPDGYIVTIVHNESTEDQAMVVAVEGTNYQFNVPGSGWATLNIKP